MSQEPRPYQTPQPEDLTAQGKAGEPIVLPIAGGPATGYAWRLELPEDVERIEDGPNRLLDPSVRLGGAAGGYLRVKAKRGDYVIIARLARPWEPDRSIRVVRVRLHVE
jgi:predicted secreted protein